MRHLGQGNSVLFIEVSSFQWCPYRRSYTVVMYIYRIFDGEALCKLEEMFVNDVHPQRKVFLIHEIHCKRIGPWLHWLRLVNTGALIS